MRKHVIVIVVILFQSLVGWSQYVIKSQEELQNLKQVPLEKAYLSTSSQVAFTGEYLYYGFYCFNAQNSRLSTISAVGYVALVNEAQEYVFEQKLKLDNGLGQGEFFIPTNLASGNYKLLAYTQWMKNSGLPQVFKMDLAIINPYFTDQSALLAQDDESAPSSTLAMVGGRMPMDSSTVGFVFNKTEFNPREKVNFSLKNYKGYLGNGAYSIKVQKKSPFVHKAKNNALGFSRAYLNVEKQLPQGVGDSIFLPEQRGELLFGTVVNRETGTPVANTPVTVSLPGKEFVLKFTTTDEQGNFYTYLRKDYKERLAVVQLEDGEKDVDIKMGQTRALNTEGLTYTPFYLDEAAAEEIKKRSVYNQVENQFFSLKPDSLLLGDPIDPFDGGTPEIFTLDEYTRFPTFQETLVEILNNAGYRNNPKGNDYIRIAQDFEKFNEEYNSFPAIVLIDGVLIPNHESIKQYDAKKIETIKMIRDQFQLANKQYQGILSIETFDGDHFQNYRTVNAITTEIIKPIPVKNYYAQSYGDLQNPYERIPDYRTLLFWKPFVKVESNSLDFEFFASDVKGEYEVILDGFTSYGKPISFSRTISIK